MHKLKLLLLLSLWVPICGMAQSGAALPSDSITAPIIWLRADGDTVSSTLWTNFLRNKLNATAVVGEGPSTEGSLNFNRALLFDGENDYMRIPYSLEGLSEFTLISVFHSSDTTERGIWTAERAVARDVMLSTRKVLGPDSIVDEYGRNEQVPVLNTIIQNWSEKIATTDSSHLAIGSSGKKRTDIKPFKGLFAEFLVYDKVLNFLERIQVETYLAIKYGISLVTGNYVSSAEKVLWHTENNRTYNNRVAGIGRDDAFHLNQKQSQSMLDTTKLLLISAGQAAATNQENKSYINNLDFLVWGDNNQPLLDKSAEDSTSLLSVLERRWLMAASGQTASQLQTELHLKKGLLPQDSLGFWLVIDRSGKGNFQADNLDYILADSASTTDSLVVYKNVNWDTDLSGSDAFGLARAKYMHAVISQLNNPSCTNPEAGTASFKVIGGCGPYEYQLTHLGSGKRRDWKATDSLQVDSLGTGDYRLSIKGADNYEVNRTFNVTFPDGLLVDLGQDLELPVNGELELDASTYIPDSIPVTYHWESSYGFSSNEGKIRISETGVYKVTITNANGCTFSDEIAVTGATVERFEVFPTIISDGHFNISLSLKEPANVSIKIYNMRGNLYKEMNGENNSEYHFTSQILEAGMYMIVLQTPKGIEAKRVIAY